MKLDDTIRLSLNNLLHREMRSWLTIIGIVIGVAAVVSIISIGAGAERAITARLGGLGADIITVSPGFSRAFRGGFHRPSETTIDAPNNITIKDIQTIKAVNDVEFVNGIISDNLEITYLSESVSLSVQGVDPLAWSEITTSEIESGRHLTPGDGNVIVIGNSIANEIFKESLLINTQISIEGKSFKVVGILKKSGVSFGGDDRTVFMHIDSAKTIMEDFESGRYSSIQVKVGDGELIEQITQNIEERLMILRHVKEDTKDFTISSSQAIQATISGVMDTLNVFLTGIASISLLVGAIGIANTMFMSVMERTRQIGVLKSLGTTNAEVMKLFIIESALIGFIGGLIGIFLGFIASGIVSSLGVGMGFGGNGGALITFITPELIVFALGFSVLIGAVSGVLPARRAANMQPVEALRYE